MIDDREKALAITTTLIKIYIATLVSILSERSSDFACNATRTASTTIVDPKLATLHCDISSKFLQVH